MSLTKSLDRLVTQTAYPGGNSISVRWGQLIRASSVLSKETAARIQTASIVPFASLGHIRGGIVTRANAYFLVREIPFDQIPTRMGVTRADLKRIAVVADGLDYLTKIERDFLKRVIKGPEALESAFAIKRGELRLFDVGVEKKALEKRHANGALAYLRRGETVNYKTSDDDLKGGVPSKRSQIKNRKPYWYSLQGQQTLGVRIVFPEHIDRRYVFTVVNKDDESVVIDKLFLFEPNDEALTQLIHVSLNSLFTWYQVELRGRSQMGEGVLELKIPDYAGLHVLNPDKLNTKQRKELLQAFAQLDRPGANPSLSELGTAERHAFDLAYLKACGFKKPDAVLLRLAQSLRALAGERGERRLSVADAKLNRRKITNVAASIDAYAARIAASMAPHPDPRNFIEEGTKTEPVPIVAEVGGPLEVGVELFNQGEVTANGVCIARAGSILAAQFVRGVLQVQPDLSQIDVPIADSIEGVVNEWTRESRKWHKEFRSATDKGLVGLDDPRTRTAVEQRALRLLHAM